MPYYDDDGNELNPDLIDARIQLGNLYLLSRDNPNAREQAEKILSKEPNNSSVHLLMSSVYVVEKDLDKAISEAKKAIEQDPKKIEAYLQLANLSEYLNCFWTPEMITKFSLFQAP